MREIKPLKIGKRKAANGYVAHISIIDNASRDLERDGFIPGDSVQVYQQRGAILIIPIVLRNEMQPLIDSITKTTESPIRRHVYQNQQPAAVVNSQLSLDQMPEKIAKKYTGKVPDSPALNKAEQRYREDLDLYAGLVSSSKSQKYPNIDKLKKIFSKVYMIKLKTLDKGVRDRADDLLLATNHLLKNLENGGRNV